MFGVGESASWCVVVKVGVYVCVWDGVCMFKYVGARTGEEDGLVPAPALGVVQLEVRLALI